MRPLLGTTVAIGVAGRTEYQANRAIDAAFAVVAHIHDRMSFQCHHSDVSRLNRAPVNTEIRVDADTITVLRLAKIVACASQGAFDPTVAGDLIRAGVLTPPAQGRVADPTARWDTITLGDSVVRLQRPVWLDLSGIAKGYAVDRAVEALVAHGVEDGFVDAGGDLRLFGTSRRIGLRTGFEDETMPMVSIENASLASSGGCPDARCAADGQHRHGRTRGPTPWGHFACVVAETCAVADALTKVVLALGSASGPVLSAFGATAHLREAHGRWHHLNGG